MEDNYIAKKKEILKNRLYGLLCERENEGQWEEFLDNILLDLTSYSNEEKSFDHYQLIAKLTSCKYLSYKYYRKVIFESMTLIDKGDVL